MKFSFSSQRLLLFLVTVLLGATLLIVSSLSNDPAPAEQEASVFKLVQNKKPAVSKSISITIPVSKLKQDFEKTNKAGFYIHFYPVVLKEKGNPEITVFYTDNNAKAIENTGALTTENFKKGVTNYMQLLKSMGVSKEKIANDFQLYVDNILLSTVDEVNVTINMVTQNMHYVHKTCQDKKATTKSAKVDPPAYKSDSILCCKCPPACMFYATANQSKVVGEIIKKTF